MSNATFKKKKMFHFEISKAKRAETAGTSHSLFQFLSNCVENDWNPGNDVFRSPNTRSQLLRCWGTHLKRADNFHNFFTFSLIWIGLYVTWSADEPDRCGTLILFLEIIFFFWFHSFARKRGEQPLRLFPDSDRTPRLHVRLWRLFHFCAPRRMP